MTYKFAYNIVLCLASVSYSYGFCRSWTLPLWSDISKSSVKEVATRLVISGLGGTMYVLPPFCAVKYYDLWRRIQDKQKGIEPRGKHWREWGMYHPRVL